MAAKKVSGSEWLHVSLRRWRRHKTVMEMKMRLKKMKAEMIGQRERDTKSQRDQFEEFACIDESFKLGRWLFGD